MEQRQISSRQPGRTYLLGWMQSKRGQCQKWARNSAREEVRSWWVTVSNAADRSRRMRTEERDEALAVTIDTDVKLTNDCSSSH